MSENKAPHTYQKRALLLCVLLGFIVLGSILWILFHSSQVLLFSPNAQNNNADSTLLYADIYQDGELKQSILLSTVTESYTFTIYDTQNSFNQIEVRPGSIGIVSASCPDKLCVHQGFIHSSLLPITCLPNRLVIQLRQENVVTDNFDNGSGITPDIITY